MCPLSFFYASDRYVVIPLVKLKTDEIPICIHAGNCGRAAAHTVVKHRIALVGVRPYKIFYQRNGLLRGMDLGMRTLEIQYGFWIFIISYQIFGLAEVAITPVRLHF